MAEDFSALALDYVNYYGLVKDKQIMFCLRDVKALKNIIISPFKKKVKEETQYKMSEEGEKFYDEECPIFIETHYMVNIIYHSHQKFSNILMWEKLFKDGLFPYWDPKGGPHAMHNDNVNKGLFVVICETFSIPYNIAKKYIVREKPKERVWRKIDNQVLLDVIEAVERKKPIYDNISFMERSKRIMEIIAEYRPKNN